MSRDSSPNRTDKDVHLGDMNTHRAAAKSAPVHEDDPRKKNYKMSLLIVKVMLCSTTMNLGITTPTLYFYLVDPNMGGTALMVALASSAAGVASVLSLGFNRYVPKRFSYQSAFCFADFAAIVGMLTYVCAKEGVAVIVGRFLFGIFYGVTLSIGLAVLSDIARLRNRDSTEVVIETQIWMSFGFIAGALASFISSFLNSGAGEGIKFDRFTGGIWFNIALMFWAFFMLIYMWEEPELTVRAPSPRAAPGAARPAEASEETGLLNSSRHASYQSSHSRSSSDTDDEAESKRPLVEVTDYQSDEDRFNLRVQLSPLAGASASRRSGSTGWDMLDDKEIDHFSVHRNPSAPIDIPAPRSPTSPNQPKQPLPVHPPRLVAPIPPATKPFSYPSFFIVGFCMFLWRFQLCALEALMAPFSASILGWTDWQNALLFTVLNIISMGVNLLGAKITSINKERLRWIDSISLQVILSAIGVFSAGMFFNWEGERTNTAKYVIACALYFSVSIVLGVALNKASLLKVVGEVDNKMMLIGYASVFGDLGRMMGPLWVVLGCSNWDISSGNFEALQLCKSPNPALYGLLGSSILAFLLLLCFRTRLMSAGDSVAEGWFEMIGRLWRWEPLLIPAPKADPLAVAESAVRVIVDGVAKAPKSAPSRTVSRAASEEEEEKSLVPQG